jgi:hypothetical protein
MQSRNETGIIILFSRLGYLYFINQNKSSAVKVQYVPIHMVYQIDV